MSRPALFALAVLLCSAPVRAEDEIWKWADDDGQVHYTNDKSQIPAPFRAKATRTHGEDIGVVTTHETPLSGVVDKILTETTPTVTVGNDEKPAAKYKNDVRQVIVFSAGWCQPCLLLKKQRTLEQLVEAHPELKLIEIDADAKEAVAKKYGVVALPTVVFADPKGKEFLKVKGARSLSQFEQALGQARGPEVD